MLLLELRVVREILEAAAAAGGEVHAGRLDALRPRPEHLGRERLGMVALDLGDARPNTVARQPAPHEDDEAVKPRDPVAAVRERIDVELELLPLRHRRGHRRTVAAVAS